MGNNTIILNAHTSQNFPVLYALLLTRSSIFVDAETGEASAVLNSLEAAEAHGLFNLLPTPSSLENGSNGQFTVHTFE